MSFMVLFSVQRDNRVLTLGGGSWNEYQATLRIGGDDPLHSPRLGYVLDLLMLGCMGNWLHHHVPSAEVTELFNELAVEITQLRNRLPDTVSLNARGPSSQLAQPGSASSASPDIGLPAGHPHAG